MAERTGIKNYVTPSTARSRRPQQCEQAAKTLGIRSEYVTWETTPRPGWYVSTPWAKVYVAGTERQLKTFLAGWSAGELGPLTEALTAYYPKVYLTPTPDYLLDFDVLHPPVASALRPRVEAEAGRGTQATKGLRVYQYRSRGFVLLRDYRKGEPTWGVRYDRWGWKLEAALARGKNERS